MLTRLSSLDLTYSVEAQRFEPDRYRDLLSLPRDEKLAVQGSGLSLAPCSFGRHARVVSVARFDRILSFDPEARVVEAEAGITLRKLYDFLAPRGYCLGVQPGYPGISLGGCIGANVHGKNHYREGCFVQQVVRLRLFHPRHGIMDLEPGSDAFELTCGGYGLTGIVLSAAIRVQPLASNAVEVTHIQVPDLATTFRLLDELKDEHDLLYSWNDLATFDRAMGRGYVVAGKLVRLEDPPVRRKARHALRRPRPGFRPKLISNLTLPWINGAYYRATRGARQRPIHVFDALFPWATKSFYFDFFGREGLIEPQVLVPTPRLAEHLEGLTACLRKYRQPFSLASFKLFRGQQRLLRYDGSGISYSLNVPFGRRSLALLDELDTLNIRCGGFANLIKDSRVGAATARAQFPEFDEFARRLHSFDPARQFVTALSERLEL